MVNMGRHDVTHAFSPSISGIGPQMISTKTHSALVSNTLRVISYQLRVTQHRSFSWIMNELWDVCDYKLVEFSKFRAVQ